MTLTIEIQEKTRSSLEKFAVENGKQTSQLASEIIDEFIGRESKERADTQSFSRLAESTFDEWENEEDSIYDSL